MKNILLTLIVFGIVGCVSYEPIPPPEPKLIPDNELFFYGSFNEQRGVNFEIEYKQNLDNVVLVNQRNQTITIYSILCKEFNVKDRDGNKTGCKIPYKLLKDNTESDVLVWSHYWRKFNCPQDEVYGDSADDFIYFVENIFFNGYEKDYQSFFGCMHKTPHARFPASRNPVKIWLDEYNQASAEKYRFPYFT